MNRRARRAALIALAGAVAACALALWLAWTRPAGGRAARPPYAAVRVPVGATFAEVCDTLRARGLARHPLLLRAAARLSGRDRRLRAGVHMVPRGLSPRDLLGLLVEGRAAPVRVVLPEGLVAREIAARVAEAIGGDAADFLDAADERARAGVLARGLLPRARAARLDALTAASAAAPHRWRWCEGYLAPDTYFLAPGLPAQTAARAIVDAGLDRADSLARGLAPSLVELGLSPHDVVTLASIVETETSRPRERPLVAAVYANRLRREWRLEADPTVAYALGKQGERLYWRDLDVDSPFNTYRVAGLPPAPICNPGAAALRAAARPDPACDALFFVADGQGGHVFSRTRAAHEAAVRLYRARRAKEGGLVPPAR